MATNAEVAHRIMSIADIANNPSTAANPEQLKDAIAFRDAFLEVAALPKSRQALRWGPVMDLCTAFHDAYPEVLGTPAS
jgi:hypothetical protein